jgi:hypothetical protein
MTYRKHERREIQYLIRGNSWGLNEVAHYQSVCRSENDAHPIVESDTVDAIVDATVPKRNVNPKCVSKS